MVDGGRILHDSSSNAINCDSFKVVQIFFSL